jgi:hypothetical protein
MVPSATAACADTKAFAANRSGNPRFAPQEEHLLEDDVADRVVLDGIRRRLAILLDAFAHLHQ